MKRHVLIIFSYIVVKVDYIYMLVIKTLIFYIVCALINSDRIHGQFIILRPDQFILSIFSLFPTAALIIIGRCLPMFATRVFWWFRASKRQVAIPHTHRCDRREHKIFTV